MKRIWLTDYATALIDENCSQEVINKLLEVADFFYKNSERIILNVKPEGFEQRYGSGDIIKCRCGCHSGDNVKHVVPCCDNGFIKISSALKSTAPRFCRACNMMRAGVKTRIALKHTCGLGKGEVPSDLIE